MDLNSLAGLLGASGAGAGAGAANGALLEFKAGKMTLSGTTVTADPRRGKIVLTNDHGMLRFQWKPRPSGSFEDNLIIFPDDAKVELIPECKTGRVILITFNADPSKKLFYWLQESNVEKDEEILKRLTELFSHGVSGGAAAAGGGGAGLSEQEQLMRLFSGAGAGGARPAAAGSSSNRAAGRSVSPASRARAAPAAAAPAPAASAAPAAAASPAAAAPAAGARAPLSGDQLRSAADIIAQATANMQAMAEAQHRSLNAILDPEHVLPLLREDPSIISAVVEHLPEGQRTPESIEAQLRSPQLQQTLGRLTLAFNQGQGAAILAQLGLPRNSAIGVDSLLEALRQYSASHSATESKSSDDSNKMDVDQPDQPKSNQ